MLKRFDVLSSYNLRRKPLWGSDTDDRLFLYVSVVPLETVPGSSPGTTIFKSYKKIKSKGNNIVSVLIEVSSSSD